MPKDAPESISRAVASLPPEQMHQLMKEMKECINNNPHEARNMLLQNPQLAYALLQAQVSMRIVDPDIAMKMLHRQAPVQPLLSSGVNTRQLGSDSKAQKLAKLDSKVTVSVPTSVRQASVPQPVQQPKKEPTERWMRRLKLCKIMHNVAQFCQILPKKIITFEKPVAHFS